MSNIYDQKPANKGKHYDTIKVTREELVALAGTGVSFRQFLEQKGIVHRRGLHVESWTPNDDTSGVICYRNYKQQSLSQIANEEVGVGRIR